MGDREEAGDERAIMLALDGETHTLGNALRDVMWAHPHVELASYTQEHPSSSEIILRCQTTSAVSAEQGVVEALHMTKDILDHMATSMEAAVAEWAARQLGGSSGGAGGGGGTQQQQQQHQPLEAEAEPAEAMDEGS